jgi:hypothetical protein
LNASLALARLDLLQIFERCCFALKWHRRRSIAGPGRVKKKIMGAAVIVNASLQKCADSVANEPQEFLASLFALEWHRRGTPSRVISQEWSMGLARTLNSVESPTANASLKPLCARPDSARAAGFSRWLFAPEWAPQKIYCRARPRHPKK